jgi:hypothetical protein
VSARRQRPRTIEERRLSGALSDNRENSIDFVNDDSIKEDTVKSFSFRIVPLHFYERGVWEV